MPRKSTRLVPLLESLESRVLLSAGDWSGTWYFTGFSCDAARSATSAILKSAASSRSATIGDLPGDQCQLKLSGLTAPLVLTHNGDTLNGHFTGLQNGANKDEYFQIKLISPGIAILMDSAAGFETAAPANLAFATGIAGLFTRTKPAAVARPWSGTYDVQRWAFQASSGTTACTTDTTTATLSQVSATTFQVLRSDTPDDPRLFTTSGASLVRTALTTEPPGTTFETRSWIVRTPGDWLLCVDGGIRFNADHTQILFAADALSLYRPQAASQYKPDLRAVIGTLPGGGLLIPGETLKVPVTLFNDGNAPLAAPLRLDLFASSDAQLDLALDTQLASLTQTLRLAPGASLTLNLSVTIPATARAGIVQLLAAVDPQNTVGELHEDNNLALSSPATIAWQFGTLPGRTKSTPLTLQEADGSRATFTLTGPGTGTVTGDRWDLALANTDPNTTLNITVKGGDGRITLGNISLASLKSLSAPAVNLDGNLLATGALSSLTLADIAPGHAISLRGAAPLTFTAGRVASLALDSTGPIKQLRVLDWTCSGTLTSSIAAPSLASLQVTGNPKAAIPGDFLSDLTLAGPAAKVPTLGSATIAGQLGAGTWHITGASGKISAGPMDHDFAANITGTLAGLAIKGTAAGRLAAQSISAISIAGNLDSAQFLAGADLGSDAALGGQGTAADTFRPGAIGAFSVTGTVSNSTILAGVDPFDHQFNDLNDVPLAGGSIKSISLTGTLDAASRFDAARLPASARIAGTTLATARDSRFGQNKFALTDGALTDATGAVTLNLAGQPQTFQFLDETTLAPLVGAGVALAVDAQSLAFGVLTVITPGRRVPVQFITLNGRAAPIGILARAARSFASASASETIPVLLNDVSTKATLDIVTDKLVQQTFYTVAESQRDAISSQVGFLASGFTSLVSIGIHGLDNVTHGAVSDYLAKLPIATNQVMTPQQAKDHIVQSRIDDLTGTLLLAGMKGKLDPLAPCATAIDLGADGVAWGVADMTENLPGMGVRVTKILGMEIYSYAAIPPWQRAADAGLVNVQIPTAADAQNGFLELISQSNPGEGFVTPLDSAGNAQLSVPLGSYAAVVHAPGFTPAQLPVSVTSAGTSLNVTLDDPPTPGFDFAPTSTLHTSEPGTSASFYVALKTQPTANVTLKLACSDPTEGRLSKTSLTFTPANWGDPQLVVITGVNDSFVDGSQSYSILTGPAVSADPAYSALKPADLSVINSDDEAPATPTVTFDSLAVVETYQEWVGDPVWGGTWERFRVRGTATAAGPLGTYIYCYPGAIANTFTMDNWSVDLAGNHYRAAGDPGTTHFTFDIYTDWRAVYSQPYPSFTASVEADLWSVDPYLSSRISLTIPLP